MQDQAAYWNAAAASFDEEPDHGLRDPAVYAAWTALLESLLPSAPARIADIGCGTGSLSCLLAARGHLVSGLDVAPAMIEHARAKAGELALDIDFTVGDAASLPWPDRSVEVILCRHLLWALDDPAAVLRDWLRVLEANGRLVLIEGQWSTGAGMPASTIVRLLREVGRSAAVIALRDPSLWGRPITDERYLVMSPGEVDDSGPG